MPSSRPFAPVDASRPRARVLTPSSDSILNQNPSSSFNDMSQKRHRNSLALEHLLNSAITVKASPNNVLSEPHILQPLFLLARDDLQLSYLDLVTPCGELPQSRLYESHIKILDLEGRMNEKSSVLVARAELSRTTYVIERANTNSYTICKLGSWVDLLAISTQAIVSSSRITQARPATTERSKSAGKTAATTTSYLHKEHKEKKLAIEALQSIVRKRARSQSISTLDGGTKTDKRRRSNNDDSRSPTNPLLSNHNGNEHVSEENRTIIPSFSASASPATIEPMQDVAVSVTTDEMLQNIRTQYMETLYKSKGSLAYFAKGPLSRAKAAFHLDCDGTLNMKDLTEFLKSLVMTTVLIDKKYRETIPDVLSKFNLQVDSSDGTKSKKRKAKKMKLGKDGLYTTEASLIRKWWEANEPSTPDEGPNSSSSAMRSHLTLLRTRETQLQMIIILEVLALEQAQSQDNDTESCLPGMQTTSLSATPEQPPRKRNRHNLPVLVDVHADRLCIWQSTASDELRMLEDSQQPTTQDYGNHTIQKSSADPLRDFCTDIIVPFFAARLPDLCDSVNRKLGGPAILPTSKPKSSKTTKRPESKPGGSIKRPAPNASSKTIGRAFSSEQARRSVSRGPGNTIALMRSATSAAIPGLKRETSDQPLFRNMNRPEPSLLAEKPITLPRSVSLMALDDTRANKKAEVESELRHAISALRRPNRELAGKAIVEEAERRTSGGLSHIRKLKKPTRHPSFQGVQVKATPASQRFRDVLAVEGGAPESNMTFPSSSAQSVVPGSTTRRSTKDLFASVLSSNVKATPAKPSKSLAFGTNDEESVLPSSSPILTRKPSRPLALPDEVARLPLEHDWPDLADESRIHATPVKALKTFSLLAEDQIDMLPTTEKEPMAVAKTRSIYERLGWDDELL